MVRPFVWRDVSGTVSGGGSNGRWTVVSSDNEPLWDVMELANHYEVVSIVVGKLL